MRHWPLLIGLTVYCLLVYPRLDNFPPVNIDDAYQMGPAHGLFTRGVWGSAPLGGAATLWRGSHPDEKMYLHPPLYFLLVAASLKLFGWGVLQARLVSTLFGLGSVAVTYALTWILVRSRTAAVTAALLLTTQPVFVHISRQARPESALTFFTVLAVYLFVRYHQETGATWALLTGFASGAALMSHYNGVFGLIAVLVLFLIEERPVGHHLNSSGKPLTRLLPHVLKQYLVSVFKSKRRGLFFLGIFLISLPYGVYVLLDYDSGFYNFKTQISVIGRAGTFNTLWEFVKAEPTRYNLFFHDYRFAPGSIFWLKCIYVCVLAFALFRRKSQYGTLLIVLGIHLLLLVYPSPNKTPVYLGAVLPYLTTLISLALVDLKEMPKLSKPYTATCFYVLATLLVLTLLYWNGRVWWSSYNKYRDCDFEDTVAQIRAIIPRDTKSIMGRYDFWIGLNDYEFYRYGFRTFDDIAAIRPEIFIHNDLLMHLPASAYLSSAELKRQLDSYFREHAEEIGRVQGHAQIYCFCGDLRIYRVEWE